MNNNTLLLDGISVFVEVVEQDSFSAAAKSLGHSPSYISKEINRLEERLGARLLNRTTRSISLTDTGRVYFERCRYILDEAMDAERCVVATHHKPHGRLKVSAGTSFCLSHLNPILAEFQRNYPNVAIELDVTDRQVDIVAEGFDVVVRGGILTSSDLIARKLMTSPIVCVASPDYLLRNGTPQHPTDLHHHSCASFSYRNLPGQWEFVGPDGQPIFVKITPSLTCNSAETEVAMAVAGSCITMVPGFACQSALDDGQLQSILADYALPPIGIYTVYPSRAHLSAKVRVFVDFLSDKFANTSDK